MTAYRICTRCVMDTSDPYVEFASDGTCRYCAAFDREATTRWFPNKEGERRLSDLVSSIRRDGTGQQYDCVIGLSGGLDSSYLALRTSELGLRVLAVHVDTGWNSEAAVANIERLVDHCQLDLHTEVIHWPTMRALQLAYFRSGLINQDVPQDHAIFASLYRTAARFRVGYVLSGFNFATESVAVPWHGPAMDGTNLKAVFDAFGQGSLEQYPVVPFWEYYIKIPLFDKLRTVSPLNYMRYDKDEAIGELKEKIEWREYGRKHGESKFTRFFQNYYLPERLNLDKRRPHLSSQILAGQITRSHALQSLAEPLYDPYELVIDRDFLLKKLRITLEEWEEIMRAPVRSHLTLRNWTRKRNALVAANRSIARITGRKPKQVHA